MNAAENRETNVWDPFVRASHWVVAVGFVLAYVVEDEPLAVHVWAGYVVGGLILLRIAWGFVGPRHARFADFVYRPATILAYIPALLLFRAKRYIGHSPAGGAMVVALLVTILATSVTGVFLYGAEEHAGPAAGLYAAGSHAPRQRDAAWQLIARAQADDDAEHDDEDGEDNGHGERDGDGAEALEEAHEVLANLSLALVIGHIAGVLLASVVHRENLPRSMITGRKRL